MGGTLPAGVRVFDALPALQDVAAAMVVAAAANAVRRRGAFHIGLAGGRTPRGLYQLLARAPWLERIDWPRVHVWFGDERCVPPEHPDSNFRMAHEALLAHVPVPADQVHRMRGELGAAEAALLYEQELRAAGTKLDLLLLGMGADGHTASLFPGSLALGERRRLVVAALAPVEPRQRVSLGLVAIRAARRIVFLVTGPDKALAIARIFRAAGASTPELPASLVRAAHGAAPNWLLDDAAASRASGASTAH